MDAEALRQELFAAIAAQDGLQFSSLCAEHAGQIFAIFRSWQVIPTAIRTNQDAVNAWVNSLVLIARYFESAGYPQLLRSLTGEKDEQPVTRWSDGLIRGQELASQQAFTQSNEVLLQVLSEMEGCSGSAIDNLRPKVLGAIGINYTELGDHAAGLQYTERALHECKRIGDEIGVRTYVDSRQILQALLLPTIDPDAASRLHKFRDTIVAAQKLSDGAKYESSNAALIKLWSESDPLSAELCAELAGKLCGLVSWNFFHLRQLDDAVKWVDQAIQACTASGDSPGVRIYQENLDVIRRAQAAHAMLPSKR